MEKTIYHFFLKSNKRVADQRGNGHSTTDQ